VESGEQTMRVNSIFNSISGEVGIIPQGAVTTFIRFQGCNLQCDWCFGIVPGRRIPRISYSRKANKKLNEVQVGDKLMTFDQKTNEVVETVVQNVLCRKVDKWLRITVEGTQYFVTEEHPFFTTKGLLPANKLRVNDKILHSSPQQKISFQNGFVVESIKKIDRWKIPPSIRPNALKVYNLQCSPHNSYIIDNMWVHNCDTLYAQDPTGGEEMRVSDIVMNVPFGSNVVLTGGEPLLQPATELVALIEALRLEKCVIQIETNGSRICALNVPLVLDYKTPSSGMTKFMISDQIFVRSPNNSWIKFVLKTKEDLDFTIKKIRKLENIRPSTTVGLKYALSVESGEQVKQAISALEIYCPAVLYKIVFNVQLHKILDLD